MNYKDLTQFAQNCIQIPSITGQEKEFIQFLIHEMEGLGYDRTWVDKAGNAVGEIKGTLPGKNILLDAHADTVTVKSDDWSVNPFSGIIKDDRLYGRGTADTKGNLAAMIYGAAAVDRSKLHGSIFVSATVNEEVVEGGSIQTVVEQVNPDYVIIGEATQLNINRGGRGRAEILVETIGRSAHSSSPEIGVCAVHYMLCLITEIDSQPPKQHPVLGPGSMVLTDIVSEPYPGHSVIPNRCKVTFDRRLLVDETVQSLKSDLEIIAQAAGIPCTIQLKEGTETTYTGHPIGGFKFYPAWLFAEDHPLVQAAFSSLQAIQPAAQLNTFRFCTNGAYTAGIAGIPTIGYGLGQESDAHTVDESIFLADLHSAAEGYRVMVEGILNQTPQ
jgi:putative selenium metabolism hydrolase